MVGALTSLSRTGLTDWLIQRVSAVVLGAYFLFILTYLVMHPQLEFADWQLLFSHTIVRVFNFLVILSLVSHAWIGMWTVYTDYIKPTWLRLLLQLVTIGALLAYLAWGLQILWGF